MPTEQTRETGTREQLERLARWMGRRRVYLSRFCVELPHCSRVRLDLPPTGFTWNPFLDANADVQVLERALEQWEDGCTGNDRLTELSAIVRSGWRERDRAAYDAGKHSGYAPFDYLRYQTGDFARAVLKVLEAETVEGATT